MISNLQGVSAILYYQYCLKKTLPYYSVIACMQINCIMFEF